MSRRQLSPRVTAGVDLTEIVIGLHPLLGPTVRMRGEVQVPGRRRGDPVEAVFETKAMPPEFQAFIGAVKAMFGERTCGGQNDTAAGHEGSA